jgi:hypothetical protein
MRKGSKKAALVACCVLAGILGWSYLATPEPRSRGHPLSYWVLVNAGRIDETHYAPRTVIAEIGTNALPYLLRWMAQKPYRWQIRLQGFSYRHAVLGRFMPGWMTGIGVENRAEAAVHAVSCLGEMGAPAIPQLLSFASNPTNSISASDATFALCGIGPPAFPSLLNLATNLQTLVPRFWAIECLGGLGNAAAVPTLAQCVADPDTDIASAAADALGRLKLQPDVAIPALIKGLGRTVHTKGHYGASDVRYSAVHALGKFGTNADAAVPPLLILAKEREEDSIHCQIMLALGCVSAQPEPVLPTLTSYLQSTNRLLRLCAAKALGQMGPRAHSALVNLTNALQFADTRDMAITAIRMISAEVLTNSPAH